MNLLCRLNIHHAQWEPQQTQPAGHGWIKLRTCVRCGLPLPLKPTR